MKRRRTQNRSGIFPFRSPLTDAVRLQDRIHNHDNKKVQGWPEEAKAKIERLKASRNPAIRQEAERCERVCDATFGAYEAGRVAEAITYGYFLGISLTKLESEAKKRKKKATFVAKNTPKRKTSEAE